MAAPTWNTISGRVYVIFPGLIGIYDLRIGMEPGQYRIVFVFKSGVYRACSC